MTRLGIVLALGCLTLSSHAKEWTGFRGPNGVGAATDTDLPVLFGPKTNLRWKFALPGRGLSNPVITGGKVFVTACSGAKQRTLHLIALREQDGTKLWERQLTATGSTQCHPDTSMAAPTPTTDGKTIYALWACGDLAAFDLEGNLLWYRSLFGDYPNISNQLGLAASPLIYKDVLLVPMENAGDSFAVGVDAKTGKNLWRVKRQRDINWVSPILVERDGQVEAIFQTEADVTAYEPRTGKEIWSLKGRDTSGICSPVLAEGMLIVGGKDMLALKSGKPGETPEIVWKSSRLPTGMTSPAYAEGKLYVVKSRVGLVAADVRTGEVLWQQRIEGDAWASPVIADGKAYVVNREGVVTVVKLGAKPEVLASNAMGEKMLATPAIAGGALYLRSDQTLFCVGNPQKSN